MRWSKENPLESDFYYCNCQTKANGITQIYPKLVQWNDSWQTEQGVTVIEWLDESICPELAEEIERLKSVIEKLPDALVESLGETIQGNDYKIHSQENERWITHTEVGSGESLKQWIKSTIEKLKSK